MNKSFNKIIGNKGEDIACKYLEKSGYKIIERNYHYSKNSEIDIIALDKDCVVFLEVKTRSNMNYGHPFEAINKQKLQKIRSAAIKFMSENELDSKSCRIDGIAIVGLESPTIEHIKNLEIY